MSITLIIVAFLLLVAFTTGISQSKSLKFSIFFKFFSEPFFFVGIHSSRAVYTDRVVDTVEIGLFFVILFFDFHKDRSVYPISPEEVEENYKKSLNDSEKQ